MAGFDEDRTREFTSVMLVVVLVAIVIGLGAFFAIRSFSGGNVDKTQTIQSTAAPPENKVEAKPSESHESAESDDGQAGAEKILKDHEYEIIFETVAEEIDEILLPETPVKLKSYTFSGFKVSGDRLETDIFTLTIPDGWTACNTGDCIYMYDTAKQSERLCLFTLRSVKMNKADYGDFLDKVFGGHTELDSYAMNKNDYVHSTVAKGQKTIQVLLKPLGRQFGIMFQCHSSTNGLTDWQKEILDTFTLKATEEKPNQKQP